MTNKQIKTMSINGYDIISNQCTALEYNLYSKKLNEFLVAPGNRSLSMNHIKIHEFLDEAISVKISECENPDVDGVYLQIETADYRISIKIPEAD